MLNKDPVNVYGFLMMNHLDQTLMPKFIIYVPFLNVAGMALFPFILIKEKRYRHDEVLMNHESIHLVQQLEFFILPFYILYLINYLFNLLKYGEHYKAYLNIFFEKEAYLHEGDLDYLKKRKFWAALSFIKPPK